MEKKALVVFHIYYKEDIPYYIDKLRNITDTPWDLLVSGHNLDEDTKSQILAFKSDACFMETSNRGYDIWPFIQCIRKTDLDKYSFIIKLHTKNHDVNTTIRLNGRKYNGPQWRDEMVDVLLGSPERFNTVRNIFNDEGVGLVYSMVTNYRSRFNTVEDCTMLHNELKRLGITPQGMNFCAGTMFAARARALAFLKAPEITEDLFPVSGHSHCSGTMSHSYERILCIGVSAQGYKTVLIPKDIATFIRIKTKRAVQPVLEWLFSVDHYGENYTKYLTVFGMKFRLG